MPFTSKGVGQCMTYCACRRHIRTVFLEFDGKYNMKEIRDVYDYSWHIWRWFKRMSNVYGEYDMTWHDMTWHDMTRHDTTRHDIYAHMHTTRMKETKPNTFLEGTIAFLQFCNIICSISFFVIVLMMIQHYVTQKASDNARSTPN